MTDPVLEGLWKKVVDHWEDDATHGAFLQYCQTADRLLEAAVRYRGMAGDRARGPSAEKRLGAIALLAMAKLESQRASVRAGYRNASRIVLIAFFVLSTLVLLALTLHGR